MLRKLNENVRLRQNAPSDEARPGENPTQNDAADDGLKRKAQSPPRISPPPLKRHQGTPTRYGSSSIPLPAAPRSKMSTPKSVRPEPVRSGGFETSNSNFLPFLPDAFKHP